MGANKPIPEATRQMADHVASLTNRLAIVVLVFSAFALTLIILPELYRPGFLIQQPTVPVEAITTTEVENIVDGIDVATGLIAAEHWELVRTTCTACHSAKLVTQNRADREGWTRMIRWMQETQKLWDLGPDEALILDYLAANYAPEKKGRRARLANIEWYDLEP